MDENCAFADVLEGINDAKGEYIILLGKRMDALKHTVMRLDCASQQDLNLGREVGPMLQRQLWVIS
jgi:hypothetical protein